MAEIWHCRGVAATGHTARAKPLRADMIFGKDRCYSFSFRGIAGSAPDALRHRQGMMVAGPSVKQLTHRDAAPWRRKISASSRAGAMTPAQPGGTTSKRSRSSGLGVLLIVLVATRV